MECALQEAPRDAHRALAVGVWHQDGELIATDAERPVGVTQDVADQAAHMAQQVIACRMPGRIVGQLEIIEVDDEEGKRHAIAAVPLDLAVEFLLECPVIAEAGECVAQRILTGGLVHLAQPRAG